jgi:hypothetical protein
VWDPDATLSRATQERSLNSHPTADAEQRVVIHYASYDKKVKAGRGHLEAEGGVSEDDLKEAFSR